MSINYVHPDRSSVSLLKRPTVSLVKQLAVNLDASMTAGPPATSAVMWSRVAAQYRLIDVLEEHYVACRDAGKPTVAIEADMDLAFAVTRRLIQHHR